MAAGRWGRSYQYLILTRWDRPGPEIEKFSISSRGFASWKRLLAYEMPIEGGSETVAPWHSGRKAF